MTKTTDIVIIGCGVSGLSCGIRLLEEGFNVTILATLVPPNTTSDKAAAIWFPYHIHLDDTVKQWCRASYQKFVNLAEERKSGVSLIELHLVSKVKSGCDPWLKEFLKEFRLLPRKELPSGYVFGYAASVPLIETPIYMPYLVTRFRDELRGQLEQLQEDIKSLEELYASSSLVINCAGLGARTLFNDLEVYPSRGQVISTMNPGIKRAIADEAGPSYIIPRSKDCILGGTADDNDWSEKVDSDTSDHILSQCQRLDSSLYGLQILDAKVGLRPERNEIKLEPQDVTNECAVIHNYGHGGAGFTVSWGCADRVVELAREYYDRAGQPRSAS